MISYVVLSITLFFFTIASIEDFKKKEIYDYINFLYAIIILSLAIIHSFYLDSFDPIKYAGFGLILSFLIGGILYLLGIWGGGDAKFLIGFGASLPYLLEFSSTLVPAQASTFLLNSVSNFMSIIISISTIYIIIINCFVMFLLLLFLTKKRKKQVTLNALTLLVILILLTMGFFFQVDPFLLFLWGFFAFAISFFSDDYLMDALYLRVKKKTKFLENSDVLDSDFKTKELFYSQSTFNEGIPRNILEEIKKTNKQNVIIRKMFPMGMLLLLNFVLYGIKILSIDIKNLEMMAFLLKFLLLSFLVGGVLIMCMIVIFALRNTHKIKKIFSRNQKYLFFGITVLLVVSSLFYSKYVLILSLAYLYYFFKISKLFENSMFVLKKPLSSLVPGDWIMQDIVVKDKVYFKVEDFKLGVEEEQLQKIKELSKKNPSLNSILIKDGIAFLPPMFGAFILLLIL